MSSAPAILCVNIDVDALRLYRGIHGLPQREESAEVYTAGVARFLAMLGRLGIPGTIFSVASDLLPDARCVLQDAVSMGHEVASHSLTHPYDLFKLKDPSVELELSKQRLQDAVGARVQGFRSPGYNLSHRLLQEIAAHYRYDSSNLPSLPYFFARAAVIAAMRMTGRHSASSVGSFRQFARGWQPFLWRVGLVRLPEFPMSAVLGIPVIGTTLATDGIHIGKALSVLQKRRFINIEFHAIDFMEHADGLEPELDVEPALRVPLKTRLERFEQALGALNKHARATTLADAAGALFKGD